MGFNLLNLILSESIFPALHMDIPNIYPQPLKAKEERQLLENLKNGDMHAQSVLIEHNLRLVVHVIKKYYANSSDQDDLISIGTIGLIKAVQTFDPDKGARLATYAARCIENEILMHFRAQKKTAHDLSLDDPIETDGEGNPLTLMDILQVDDTVFDDINHRTETIKIRKYVKEIKNERERSIIILRYGLNGREPKTQNEVADILGISRSYVSRIETRALQKLKKRIENE